VHAAAERVLEARASDPRTLARLAWHVGNRHTPAQVLDGALRLLDDPVLRDMLEGLGADVVRRTAPFAPEPGAYGAGHRHGHGHGPGHGHGDGQEHGHRHGPAHPTSSDPETAS
jgi:urease accessory protein